MTKGFSAVNKTARAGADRCIIFINMEYKCRHYVEKTIRPIIKNDAIAEYIRIYMLP